MLSCFHPGLHSEVRLVREFRRRQQLARRRGHRGGERGRGGVGRGLENWPGEPPDTGRVSETETNTLHTPIQGPA